MKERCSTCYYGDIKPVPDTLTGGTVPTCTYCGMTYTTDSTETAPQGLSETETAAAIVRWLKESRGNDGWALALRFQIAREIERGEWRP